MKLPLIFFLAVVQLHAIPWMFPETLLTRENPSTTVISKIDSHGNAIAVWIAENQREPQFSVYEASTQAWKSPSSLDQKGPADIVVQPALCLNEEGKAIVFWVRGVELVARIRDGEKWQPPIEEEPLVISSDGITGISEVYADMNPDGDAAVIWSETRTDPYRDTAVVRRYVKESWMPPLSEPGYSLYDDCYTDTIDVFPSVKINEKGDLAVAWKFDGVIVARQLKANTGAWVPNLSKVPFILSGPKARFPRVGIDGAGNLHSAWVRDERIEVTRVINGVLKPVKPLGVATHAPDLAVSKNGVVVVVWPSLGEMIFGSNFSKGSWSMPMMISQIGSMNPSVGIDALGNATAAWENSATGTVQIADLYRGVWQTPVDLFPIGNEPRFAKVAISPSGNTLISWKTNQGTGEVAVSLKNCIPTELQGPPPEMGDLLPNVFPNGSPSVPLTFANLGDPPSSPASIVGKKVRNHFGLVSEIFHEVSWEHSPAPNVVGYQVFVNNVMIGEFPASVKKFKNHNKAPHDSVVYQVRAITDAGLQSHPLDVRPMELEEDDEQAPKAKKKKRKT